LLVDKFLENICAEYGIAKKEIDPDALEALRDYNWTGNIRELRNVVERLVILSGKTIVREDVVNNVVPRN
jgi:DNA-binding NtrC family response regulator